MSPLGPDQILRNVHTYTRSVTRRTLAVCGPQYDLDLLEKYYDPDEFHQILVQALWELEARLDLGDDQVRHELDELRPHLLAVVFLLSGIESK